MSLGNKALSGTIWATIDRFGIMALQFIVNLILARLLTPADYGCIGMLAIFIIVSQVLIDGGFGSALIQKREPTQEDYSTIFFWNLFFAIALYVILFFASPWIALFFKIPLLKDVLRVLGCILIINSFSIVQNNRLRKQLALKKLACINIGALVVASCIAIILAYSGFGVWSLVVMQLLNASMFTILIWMFEKWRPSLCFSLRAMKELFHFGGYLLAANILQEVCRNLQGLIIGRKFSSTEMGLYSQAKKLDDVTSLTLPNIIVQVMFPIYSQLQNDKRKMGDTLRMNVRLITFVTFPLLILLIIVAHPLILFLYGSKWEATVPYFQVLCVGGLFACLQNINYYAIASLGQSRTLFRWSFYKWGALLVLLLVGAKWGMYGILWGMVLSALNIYLVNAGLVAKHLHYSVLGQIRDILPVGGLAVSAAIVTSICIHFYSMHFLFQILLYFLIYLGTFSLLDVKVKADVANIMRIIFR